MHSVLIHRLIERHLYNVRHAALVAKEAWYEAEANRVLNFNPTLPTQGMPWVAQKYAEYKSAVDAVDVATHYAELQGYCDWD